MFTGRQWDKESGLYYYRARMYHPALGRFLQTDPIHYRGGINLYSYCMNNPVNWLDPLGLSTDSAGVSVGPITVDGVVGSGYGGVSVTVGPGVTPAEGHGRLTVTAPLPDTPTTPVPMINNGSGGVYPFFYDPSKDPSGGKKPKNDNS